MQLFAVFGALVKGLFFVPIINKGDCKNDREKLHTKLRGIW